MKMSPKVQQLEQSSSQEKMNTGSLTELLCKDTGIILHYHSHAVWNKILVKYVLN